MLVKNMVASFAISRRHRNERIFTSSSSSPSASSSFSFSFSAGYFFFQRLWIASVLLSTAAILAAGDEQQHSDRALRVSSDYALPGLRSLGSCPLADRAETGVKSNSSQIAKKITKMSRRCLEYIDDFKKDYTKHLLSINWDTANLREPPKLCDQTKEETCPWASEVYDQDHYLPIVPTTIPTEPRLNTELLKAYSLLQHYLVALNHISLGQNELSEENTYREKIQNVRVEIDNLLCYLLGYIQEQELAPDSHTAEKLTPVIFTRELRPGKSARREFVFLRDVRAGVQYINTTFSLFLPDD